MPDLTNNHIYPPECMTDDNLGDEATIPDYLLGNLTESPVPPDYVPIETLAELFSYQRIGDAYEVMEAEELNR